MKRSLFLTALALGTSLCLATSVRADTIDDLLAGKPVSVEIDTPSAAAPKSSVEDRVVVSRPEAAGQQPAPWEVGITHPPASELKSQRYVPDEEAQPIMVPEPAAFGLAGLALVYFLIFFRRRHLV